MVDISNKTLAILLLCTIFISITIILTSLHRLNQLGITGASTTATGNATVNITTLRAIRFTVSTIDWGSGSVNTTGGYVNCTLNTSGTGSKGSGCIGFNTVTGLILENIGNENINVTIQSNATAAQFIGGSNPSPEFKWAFSNNESSSCITQGPSGWGSFVDVSTSPIVLCHNFSYLDSSDSIRVDLYVLIPYTAPNGTRTATITATISS